MLPTNPFLLAIVCGVLAYIVVHFCNKYTSDPDNPEQSTTSPVKVCLLVTLISGLLAFYLKYVLQAGVEIVTEHFEIGNPTF